MATQYDPIAKDGSLNTTEATPRNIADVLAEGLKGIEDALPPSYTEGDGIDISNNEISVDTTFTEASTRTNIASGESFSTILGKIKKFFTDLKTVAFTGAYSDLTGQPDLTNVAYKNVNNQFSANQNIDAKNGTTSAVGYTDLNIGNDVAAGTAGNSTGVLRLYGDNGSSVALLADRATATRYVRLPDKGGTIALTSDIPVSIVDVPYSDFTWDSTNKYFVTANPITIPTGKTCAGFLVYATNGAAIMNGRITNANYVQVMGWIPSLAQPINDSYVFSCKMVLI